MRILLIGGTRFIGPHVVRGLVADGHEVTVYHRGVTETELPESVNHIHGDRRDIQKSDRGLTSLRPDIVLDMVPRTEGDARLVIDQYRGVANRVIAVSSGDVYRNYDRLRKVDDSEPDPSPLAENAALRTRLFPYRSESTNSDDWRHHYEKIHVERAYLGEARLPATILRLPMVYGPGDYQHRLFPYIKRMDDGRPAILLDEGEAAWHCSHAYVEDVAHAILLAIEDDDAVGRVYNVAEETTLTELEWVQTIAQAVGWKGKIVALPEHELPKHLQSGMDWRHHLSMSSKRIRGELGYAELTPPETALRRTIDWERQHPPANADELINYQEEDAVLSANVTD